MQRKPELGKYLLWLLFRRHAGIRRYLPATKRYSRQTLGEFLKSYQTVYVKPVAGSMGRGILKVWQTRGKIAVQKTTDRPRLYATLPEACRYIDAQRQGKAYIVQQGLELATVGGRPFDIRVMMQREKPGGKWQYSGSVAKIAGKGSVVTNVALSRGTVMEVQAALRQAFRWSEPKINSYMQQMVKLSFQAASHFDTYQKYRELGFDIAIDRNGRIWLIEENTGPSHGLFAKLTSNKTMYRTIQRRAALYRKMRRKV